MFSLRGAGAVALGVIFLLYGPAEAGPLPASLALGPEMQLNVSSEDRCPMCGMRPIKYPKYACAIAYADGPTFYFCSAGCLLRAWIHPQIFLSVPPAGLKRAVVQEYFSGRPTDAATVTWVAGSDVIGPMGPAFIPLAGHRHVAAFQRRHGGRHTFRLSEMTDTLWQMIAGNSPSNGQTDKPARPPP